MFKKRLLEDQMYSVSKIPSDDVLADQVTKWGRELIKVMRKEHGGMARAIECAARHVGVPHGEMWRAQYRPKKIADAGTWLKLRAWYQAQCEYQARMLEKEKAVLEEMRNEVSKTAICSVVDPSGDFQ